MMTQAPSEVAFGIFEWQRDYALRTLETYTTEVEGRVFPAFGQASRTVMPVAKEASDGDFDPEGQRAAIAKSYEENEYRKDLEFAKSRIVEMAITGLYYLWQRRVTHLLRTYERGQPGAGTPKQEMTDLHLDTFTPIRDEFVKLGWSLEIQDFYKKLNQLRLVTDAVKYGDGNSRTRLWRKFPRLFWPYNHDNYPIPEDIPMAPTAANMLELSPEHFREYAGALEAFWKAVPSLDRT